MESDAPSDLMAEASRARSKTRSARRGSRFALMTFGVIVLAAAALYGVSARTDYSDGSSMLVYGGWWVPLYWLIALPLGYLACVLSYRRQADRTGVAGAVWPFLAVGLGLFAVMAFVPPGLVTAWTPAFMAGWTDLPLLTLGAGFLVLSWLERSWYLATFSIAFLALPVLCERIYDRFIGWHSISATGFSMIMAGVVLLLAGGVTWAIRRRAR